MVQAQKADILIAIYSGDAGWAKEGGEVGICHAELEKALNSARDKVRVIQTEPLAPLRKGADGKHWLDAAEERSPFLERAAARARIGQAIAKENSGRT